MREPKYAAPLYERVPVALIRAPTPYDWMAEPSRELPHEAAAVAPSLDLKNSSLELARWARRWASPKTGPRTARETAWLKAVPRAMAEGLTGGRSVVTLLAMEAFYGANWHCVLEHRRCFSD
jgi:hypothetical protein